MLCFPFPNAFFSLVHAESDSGRMLRESAAIVDSRFRLVANLTVDRNL
jgi:hypothetical protein